LDFDNINVPFTEAQCITPDMHLNGISQGSDLAYQYLRIPGYPHIHDPAFYRTLTVELNHPDGFPRPYIL
jgi:hypothetical protein